MDPMESFGVVSGWLRDAGTSTVSGFAFLSWIGADMLDLEVYRFDLHMAALMPGSNDSISTLWRVSGWLHHACMYLVSHFAVLSLFIIDALDLELYSFDLDSSASTAGSNGPLRTFQVVLWWLRAMHES